MHSLSRRLLIAVSLPLALFFGIMMLVLDNGFRALSEHSLDELLDAQMVSLIAAADPLPNGSYGPDTQTLDPRMATPHSGLYAQIRSGVHQWRSASTAGASADFGPMLHLGQRTREYATFGHERVAILESRDPLRGRCEACRDTHLQCGGEPEPVRGAAVALPARTPRLVRGADARAAANALRRC